jgi:UDP-N-acetylmuramoyl-L-alanyl-D-glutamate--2,6-diaminopimelate ligase
MKILKDILYKSGLVKVTGTTDVEITGIALDSRKVTPGSLFVAVKGTISDGHLFIASAVSDGAKAIICEEMPEHISSDVTYVKVSDSSQSLGIIASNFYDNPSAALKLVGVTGTNGKTTIATLLHKLFRELGYHAGLLSTVQNLIDDEIIPATHTTPDAIELNGLLRRMVDCGCTHCFIEVSSHAIVQNRIAGLTFTGGVFTNLTHDHLDFHKTFDAYLKAKKRFFDELPAAAFALSNADDRNGRVMFQNSKALKKVYSLRSMADFRCRIIDNQFEGLQLEIDGNEVWCRLVGTFNAYNLLAIYATALLLEEDPIEVLTIISRLEPAEGRFEALQTTSGIIAIVDYAHTPDALLNVLDTLAEIRSGQAKIITVVGAGGDRDTTKRPIMARIAAEKSDRVILTSDNPRSEDPEEIIKEMQSGLSIIAKKKVLSITSRLEAIRTACALAKPGDIVLVAGKGHEKYQEIKGVRHPFDDKQVLKNILMNQD